MGMPAEPVVAPGKRPSGTDQVDSVIQAFLNDRGQQKIIPERDSEIDRITFLLEQLKMLQE